MKLRDYTHISKETCKLVVRPTIEADFETILYGLRGQKKQQNKYDEEEIELADKYTETFCKNSLESFRKYVKDDKAYLFRVFKKDNGGYIGGVIIKTILRGNFQWAEVGYWLLNQHWGNGYGVEMVEAAIDIAFNELGFHRLEAHINLDNIASQRTAERAGMEFECIRKKFIFENDEWTDNMVYIINNMEYSFERDYCTYLCK